MVQNIQLLRAIAAYLVVFYHLQAPINLIYGTSLWTHFPAAGVDVFFVISGFIMVFTCDGRERTPGEFWKDRIIRIVPLYWLVTLLHISLALGGLKPAGLHGWDGQSLATSLLFLPTVRPDGVAEPIVSPGWSLIYEMFFYFLFGLGLLLRNQLRAVVGLTVLFVLLYLVGRMAGPWPFSVAYYMKPIILEFVAGCILGLVYTRSGLLSSRLARNAAMPLIGVGTLVIVISGSIVGAQIYSVPELRVVNFGVPAVMIVAGALIFERSGVRYGGRFVQLQGAASYAIYLFHPILTHMVFKAMAMVLPTGAPIVTAITTVLAVVVVWAVGTFVHLRVEKPMSAALRSLWRRERAGGVVAAAT